MTVWVLCYNNDNSLLYTTGKLHCLTMDDCGTRGTELSIVKRSVSILEGSGGLITTTQDRTGFRKEVIKSDGKRMGMETGIGGLLAIQQKGGKG